AGGRVALSLAVAHERAIVSVEDTGIGIAPDVLPHVFEQFAQADSTLDRARGGLGIGLSMVKSLIEMQGGRVEARSAGIGKGACFTFWLPVQSAPAEAPAPEPTDAPDRVHRILIIEDNRDSARTLRILLTRYGHEVEVAYSGTSGLAKARQWHPDVVLCD